MADQRMANRDFVEMRQLPEPNEVVEIEVVAGVDAKTQRVRELRGARIVGERLARVRVAPPERAGEWFCIELDPVGAHFCRPSNGRLLRIHKKADANALVAHI